MNILTVLFSTFLLYSNVAWIDEDEPDFWRVTRVSEGNHLNMRKGPSTQFGVIGKIPHNATGLGNNGCTPNFNLSEWAWFTSEESKHATNMKWCKVRYDNSVGWVYFRYLKEMN